MAELSNTNIKGDLFVEGNLRINRTNLETTDLTLDSIADVVNAKRLNVETLDSYGDITAKRNIVLEGTIQSMLPDGTSPIVVLSKTECPNLNANYLQGYTADDFMKIDSYNGKISPDMLPEATTTSFGVTKIGLDSEIKVGSSYVPNKFINTELLIKTLNRCYLEPVIDNSKVTLEFDDEINSYGVFKLDIDDTNYINNLEIDLGSFKVKRNMLREVKIIIVNNHTNTNPIDKSDYVHDVFKNKDEELPPTGTENLIYLKEYDTTTSTERFRSWKWINNASLEHGGEYKEITNIESATNNSNIKIIWPKNIYWSTGNLNIMDDKVISTSPQKTNPEPFLSFKKKGSTESIIDVIEMFTVDNGNTWFGNTKGLNYRKNEA